MTRRHPVDTGWAWMVVLGCWISIFLMGGTIRTFGILLEEICVYFDIPLSLAILIMTAEGILYTFSASIGVILGEKFSSRAVVMVAGILGGLSFAVGSLTISITFLICTLGIGFGIANGFLHGNGLVTVSRYFEKRRALATGLAVSGGSIGQFVMPPIIQYLINTYSLSGTLLIIGGIYLNLLVTGSLYRPISFYDKEKKKQPADIGEVTPDISAKKQLPVNGDQSAMKMKDKLINKHIEKVREAASADNMNSLSRYASAEDIVSQSLASLSHNESPRETGCVRCVSILKSSVDLSLLKDPSFLYYMLTNTLCFLGIFNVVFFLTLHANLRGFAPYESAFLLSVNGIGDLIGRVGSGWFADLNVIKRYKILCFVVLLNGVNSIILPTASVYWWLALHCGIYGFSCGAYLPLLPVISVDFFGLEALPKALSILLFSMGALAAIQQPLLGMLTDVTGSYDIVFYMSGGICLGGSLCSLFLPRVFKKTQQGRLNKQPELVIGDPKLTTAPSTVAIETDKQVPKSETISI